jgi:Siphovirus Gp157
MATQTQVRLPEALASEMSLFQLDETLSLLMESATEEAAAGSGEIPEELRQALLEYCEAFGAKVDNIANYLKSQEGEIRNAKVEVERLHTRQAAAENRIEKLKGLLKYFMETRGLQRMNGRLNTISLRRNSQDSLIVETPDAIPADFCKLSITLGVSEWEALVSYLPDDHDLRLRFAGPDNAPGKRELDNSKLRAALQSGLCIPGAELRRGQHIRLT